MTFGAALSLIRSTFPGTTIVPIPKLHLSTPISLLPCTHPTCESSYTLTPMRDSNNRPYHLTCKYESAGIR